jgi:hypothetical protein
MHMTWWPMALVALMIAVPSAALDYADSKHCADWTHHPVFGDVSFDSFQRLPGNPVCRGTAEFDWPVNGSLFKDPVSGSWFLYVGWYLEGYATVESTPAHCRVYRSNDHGRTWKDCGKPLAGIGSYLFDGEVSPLWGAPDVAVCYKDGRYYMSFDWHTKDTTWANVMTTDPKVNSGAAVAVSDSPEGPFQPITAYQKTREMTPLLGRYKRIYASTIIPRGKDWIALTLSDSGPYFGWALLGQTAPKLEGPWTKPKLLLHPELDRYYPQLIEFFPQFVHDGYIYAPGTSVAGNRNYQALFRVPIEQAMDSDAWSLYMDGSVWHSEPVESEYEGIWGQTFSGFIDKDGTFNVMFPSRDAKNKGTINLARRPWNQPLRKRGFVISGHVNPSMAVLRHDTLLKHLSAKLKIHGTAQMMWNHHGPFAPDHPTAGCGLHALMRTQYDALELSETAWALVRYDKDGKRTEIARGPLADSHDRAVDLKFDADHLSLTLDGKSCWSGPFETAKGRVGLWAEPRSSVEADTFIVDGDVSETAMPFLYTEGLVCAAQNMADWTEVKAPAFRYGVGAVSKSAAVEVKWNFTGDGFALYAPTGPAYGKGELLLDGKHLAEIDFNSPQSLASHVLYEKRGLPNGQYGVKLRVLKGSVPVDVFEAYSR